MTHPGINDFDTGSWLDATLSEHDVLEFLPDGALRCDDSPSFRSAASAGEPLNLFNGADLCREHAFDQARALGYRGPTEARVTYQRELPPRPEPVMVLTENSVIISIASYSYGRAYFEPGEPRTQPCDVCGTEILVSAV